MRRTHLICLLLYVMYHRIYTEETDCDPTEFMCANKRCIVMAWKCDDYDDCNDNSDEWDCPSKTCAEGDFQCDNGHCISERWVCDKSPDCADNSDEKPQICKNVTCTGYQCSNSEECIQKNFTCDGQIDCPEGDDEKGCNETCQATEFQCLDKKCIFANWRCNGRNDCADGSDEINCPKTKCEDEGEKMCHDGECITELWWCDGDADCKDESDESNCSLNTVIVTCPPSEFQCHHPEPDIKCIHLSWKCDGEKDCNDGSDEQNCPQRTCDAHERMCGDTCLKEAYFCDGEVDCDDGEDERNCNHTTEVAHCKAKEFDCGNGKCIPDQKICNGADDCGNGADEAFDRHCPKQTNNSCENNNGGCVHICIPDTYEEFGRRCECYVGFDFVTGSDTECEDIDECKILGACSQMCTNTKGSYKCDCIEGYTMINHRYCKATDGKHAELILSNRHDIRRCRLDANHYTVLLEQSVSGAFAMDFDIRNEVVFWADTDNEKIYSASLETNETKIIIEKDIFMPHGLAIDWIHGNLYISNTGRGKIEVARLNGSHRKTLIDENLHEPRALVLDPNNGWMYWIDWGNQPKIEKCGMNGQHRKEIRTKDIAWPNGLTIDYVQNRLYWVDAKLHIIGSSDLDGQDYKLILRNHRTLGHPFAITVFEDFLYWTDWMSNAVHKVSKFGRGNVSDVAMDLKMPMDIHVYHIYRQPFNVNSCGNNNGGCSHLCLPAPQIKAGSSLSVKSECHCPDTLVLDGQFKCVNSDQPLVTKTPSPVDTDFTRTNLLQTNKPSSKATVGLTDEKTAVEHTTEAEYTTQETLMSKTQVETEHKVNAGTGYIAWIVIGILVVIGLTVALVVYMLMRRHRTRNVKSMNFDNPVYSKTTDQLIMDKNGSHGSRSSLPQSMQPLNQDSDIV